MASSNFTKNIELDRHELQLRPHNCNIPVTLNPGLWGWPVGLCKYSKVLK